MNDKIQLIEKNGKPYLSQIETGKRRGTTDVITAIAKALNVSVDELVS